jgi:polar amino acid transport system substrate-binding protein
MASLGTLLAGEAHDLNNLMTFTLLNATIIEKINKAVIPILDEYSRENGDFHLGGVYYSEVRDQIAVLFSDVLHGLNHIKNITENIKRFVCHEPSQLPTRLDINNIVDGAVRIVSGLIHTTCDHFKADYGEVLPPVMGMPQRISQVIINILLNACQALTDKGQSIIVSTGLDTASEKILIKIRDEGTGMSAEVLGRIKEPFFTTRHGSGGSGLGLAIADCILHDHGGTMEFDSSPGQGTTVTLSLPIAKE